MRDVVAFIKRYLPALIALPAMAWLVWSLRVPTPKTEYDTNAFGNLPALANGRVKPLDTVARTSLMILRAKETITDEAGKEPVSVFEADVFDVQPAGRIETAVAQRPIGHGQPRPLAGDHPAEEDKAKRSEDHGLRESVQPIGGACWRCLFQARSRKTSYGCGCALAAGAAGAVDAAGGAAGAFSFNQAA